MRKQSKVNQILKDQSGASLMFVLAAMFLLAAIGLSALTAAGANAGTGFKQVRYNQMNVYFDSVQKTLMDSLQNPADDVGKLINNEIDPSANDTKTFGSQLIRALYGSGVTSGSSLSDPLMLRMEIDETTLDESKVEKDTMPVVDIEVRFQNVSVDITPFKDYVEAVTDASLPPPGIVKAAEHAEPESVTLSAKVFMTVNISVGGDAMTGQAVYQLRGAVLEGGIIGDANTPLAADDRRKRLTDAGEWRLVSIEWLED